MINVPINVVLPIIFSKWQDVGGADIWQGLEGGELPCKAEHIGDRVIITNPKGNVMANISKSLFDTLWDRKFNILGVEVEGIKEDTYVVEEGSGFFAVS